MAPEQTNIDYFILMYSPHVISEPQYNLALLIFAPSVSANRDPILRLNHDMAGLRRVDSCADIEMLSALAEDLEKQFQNHENAKTFLQTMLDSFSNVIQISEKRSIPFTGDGADEIEQLCERYFG